MRLVSVNVGRVDQKPWNKRTLTALHKSSVEGAVWLSDIGLEGDEQADTVNHGGADKAVLVLPTKAYEYFEVGEPFGYLGENLSLEGVDEAEVCLGDRFQFGGVLLEVTQPRSPCWKLDAQAMASKELKRGRFLKAYSESGRVGFYCRVLVSGVVEAGQKGIWLTRTEAASPTLPNITVQDLFLAKQYRRDNAAWKTLEQALTHPALSDAWREELTKMIELRHE